MRLFIAAFILLFSSFTLQAQEQHALVIGIDKYTPPDDISTADRSTTRSDFHNLEGCKNDAQAIRSLIITRFGFTAANVAELYDRSATRDSILTALNTLLNQSKAGDIILIYYAGHGSQQVNSLSQEADKMDETIVPSDTWKKGVNDIRDKEQAKIYNAFLDKGVKLTLILDCCHSGSMSRGAIMYKTAKKRYIATNNYDAADASNPPAPEDNDKGQFLMLAAAQDSESAEEALDDHNMPHGAFTIALLEAINQQSVDASTISIFTSLHAILKSNGLKQEPVMSGKAERKNETLFGIKQGKLPDAVLIPVTKAGAKIELAGGFAESLYKEHELSLTTDTSVKIRIDSVMGINKSTAVLIKGDGSKITPGNLFMVTNWVSSKAPLLKVYIPSSGFTYEEVLKFSQVNTALKNLAKAKWVNDFDTGMPYVTAYFNGKTLYANINGKELKEQKTVSADNLLKLSEGRSIFFDIPAPEDMVQFLTKRLSANKSIVITQDPNQAQYILYGTTDEAGHLEFGFMRSQLTDRDSLEAMPLQTRCFVWSKDVEHNAETADSLYEYAMRLSKIRGWLNLQGPVNVHDSFPFHMEFINDQTHKPVVGNTSKIDDNITCHLVADPNASFGIKPKYVYIFGIDREGKMTLTFPDADGQNHLPKYQNDDSLVKDYPLFSYQVSTPVGTDTFILIASDEAIAGYENIFNQDGIRGLPLLKGKENPLTDLLNLGNEGGTRGFHKSPISWKLYRVQIKATH